jgi:tRNA C32,U32 (ribose-2'-O)-methylase TrmJ
MSLNLAQAVLILGYEWWLARSPEAPARVLQTHETAPATKAQLDNFLTHLIAAADTAGFLKNEQKRPTMTRNIRHLFQRGEVTAQELNTLHGIITDIARGPRQAR